MSLAVYMQHVHILHVYILLAQAHNKSLVNIIHKAFFHKKSLATSGVYLQLAPMGGPKYWGGA